ncbi:MAG: hypothetical protein AAGK32_14395, partial [Actinomycetota bacterium]
MVVLQQLPHTGDASRSTLLAERPDRFPDPMPTGELQLPDGVHDPVADGDEFLLEAAANGRLLRLGAGGAAVVALLVIAVALFPGRSGA